MSKINLVQSLETLARQIKAARATPVLVTPSATNTWRAGKLVVEREEEETVLAVARMKDYEAADVTQVEAEALEEAGSTKASTYFTSDPLHTSVSGGKLFAGCVMEALRRADSPLTLQNPFLLYARFHTMKFITTYALTEFNWEINRKQRAAVAPEIAKGDPRFRIVKEGGRGSEVALPKPLGYLSDGGQVLVWRKGKESWTLFFTFEGVLDSFAGFVYSTNGTIPPGSAFLGDPIEIIKLAPDWYWYSSKN